MDAGSFGEAAGEYSLAVAPALRRRNVGAPIRAAMCDTSAMTIVLIAIALYLLAAIALVVGAMRGQHPPGHGWLLPALPAVFLHVGYHVMAWRSEEHTSELQSLMRLPSAVFCLKKKNNKNKN